jgi:hypothetical protein
MTGRCAGHTVARAVLHERKGSAMFSHGRPLATLLPRRRRGGQSFDGTAAGVPDRAMSAWLDRNLAIQGYRLDAEQQRELRLGLRFPTGTCLVLVTAGLLLQSPLVLAPVAAIAAVAGFASRHPFDLVWNHGVRRVASRRPCPRIRCDVGTPSSSERLAARGRRPVLGRPAVGGHRTWWPDPPAVRTGHPRVPLRALRVPRGLRAAEAGAASC